MESTKSDGPDGSSIRPVSSLLARFETLNIAQPSTPSSPRQISPAHTSQKPTISEKHTTLDSQMNNSVPAAKPPPPKPPALKPKPVVKPKPLSMQQDPPPIPQSTKPNVSRITTTSNSTTPAVNILPPQSPPKKAPLAIAGDQSPFLDASAIPDNFPAPRSPSPLSVASRPLSPSPMANGVYSARSSRAHSPKPPSPPPPRRSLDTRRDRDSKPPVLPLSSTKPNLAPNTSSASQATGHYRIGVPAEVSPFTSPPSSPESDAETPPQLPTRPRPPSQSDAAVTGRPINDIYAPPPTHHAVLARRRDDDARGRATQDEPPRPLLPARRQTHDVVPIRTKQALEQSSPARLPRATPQHAITASVQIPRNNQLATSLNSTQNFLPPPTRTHTRSKTLETSVSETSISAINNQEPKSNGPSQVSGLADISNTNRKPPFIKRGCYEIQTKYEPKRIDICGDIVSSCGHYTRAWNVTESEQLTSLAHTEGVKATAICFKPCSNPDNEGQKLWIGTNSGDIMEIDVMLGRITAIQESIHGKSEVVRIHRYYNELWTLDEAGNLLIWGPDSDGMPNLNKGPTQTYKVPKGHSFSIVVEGELWYAAGRVIRVFEPSLDGSGNFQVLIKPLTVDGAGDINAGAVFPAQQNRLYFGHNDGRISVFSTTDYACEKIIHISGWRINSMAAVEHDLWIGHNTGKICIYDTQKPTWALKKEWQAHDSTVHQVKYDPSSAYLQNSFQVASVGGDGKIKIWDALLQDDYLEKELRLNEASHCSFDEINALVMTWNAGASTPHSLRYSDSDSAFFRDLLQSSGSPDILVFGFQELVDLEDKTATAKRFLKSKKRDGADGDHMSHQYRDWRDFLLKSLDDYMPATDLYHLLYNAPLVGLFTCIFVKSSLQGRIRNLHGAEVKRGMGGLHGNKGAIAVRFQIDNTSLCFVNCHLAAGQSQTNSRHGDIAAILDANLFPVERDPQQRLDTFICGGDGGMIVDHESSIINGDLNYRIDTMSRDTVVKAIQSSNLPKLLERDQLLAARRKNPAFRLRAFNELPINFNPTYKYDVGTDTYDTSEKRRSPAWCDRLLYRGHGTITQVDYKRHEVRVSDHRPVTGSFRIRTKRVDANARSATWTECQQRFEKYRDQQLVAARTHYLEHVCGFDEKASQRLIKARLSNK